MKYTFENILNTGINTLMDQERKEMVISFIDSLLDLLEHGVSTLDIKEKLRRIKANESH